MEAGEYRAGVAERPDFAIAVGRVPTGVTTGLWAVYATPMLLRLAALIALLMVLVGCGVRQSLTLTPEVRELAADGLTVMELDAAVIFRGDPIPDGKEVTFTCSQPLLFETHDDALPDEADCPKDGAVLDVSSCRQSGEQEVEVESKNGVARAHLLAPISGGELTVEASFTTVNQDVLSDRVTFDVAPPPLIAAGQGSESNLVSHFGFTCDQINVGALVPSRDPIEVACHLTLKDASGRDLPHTPVLLLAEAGSFRDEPATADTPRTITYVIPTSPAQMPRDVEPWAVETNEGLAEFTSDQTHHAYNPRDGLVTLLAVVRGQESFDDRNGNGVLDDDESWMDEGEPFLDVDDDGAYDPHVDPAPCCDSNNDGVVNGLNGRWDRDVWIGRMTHILWTGTVSAEASDISPDASAIAAKGNTVFTIQVVDRFFNPVAANDANDELVITVPGALSLDPASFGEGIPVEPTVGMVLNDQVPNFRFGTGGIISNPIFAGLPKDDSLLAGRQWQVTLTDARSTGEMCDQEEDRWELTATMTYTYAEDTTNRKASISAAGGVLSDLSPEDPQCL